MLPGASGEWPESGTQKVDAAKHGSFLSVEILSKIRKNSLSKMSSACGHCATALIFQLSAFPLSINFAFLQMNIP